MSFDISPDHNLYKYMCEEARLEYNNLYYAIKLINERTSAHTSTISCELELDDLKTKKYPSYLTTTRTYKYVTDNLLESTGWTAPGADTITGARSIDLQDVNQLEVLQYCTNKTMYNIKLKFDNKAKTVTAIKTDLIANKGVYFTDELNLTDVNFKGSSENLVTRLYVYGKDGLNISSIAGTEYIENHDYTNKIIAGVWRDERYTDKLSLYNDGVENLKTLAVPARSYCCKVIDLASLNSTYNFLNIQLYDIVTLIDRYRKTSVDHRIVQVRRYPDAPENNTVTLASVTQKINGTISSIRTDIDNNRIVTINKFNEVNRDIESNTAAIGNCYTKGEADIQMSSLIQQSANSILSTVNSTYANAITNYVTTYSNFNLTDWQKAYGSDRTLTITHTGQINVYRQETTASTDAYIYTILNREICLNKNRLNYVTVTVRIKSDEPCRIGLCWLRKFGDNGSVAWTAVPTDAIKKGSLTQNYIDVSKSGTWYQCYAQIYNPNTTQDCFITKMGIFLYANTEYSPPDSTVTLDYYQVSDNGYVDERMTQVEQTADGLSVEVAKKVNNSEWSTKVQQSATDIQIAWNRINKIVQLADGELQIRTSNMDSADKLMGLAQDGLHLYNSVGDSVNKLIRTTMKSPTSSATYPGLSFDITPIGKYICFADYDNNNKLTIDGMLCKDSSIYEPGWHFFRNTYLSTTYLSTTYLSNSPLYWGANSDSLRTVVYSDGEGLKIGGNGCGIYSGAGYLIFRVLNNEIHCYQNLNMHNNSITNQSDARLKTNIQDSTLDALALFNQLDLKSFDWLENGTHESLGIIAQQLQEVAPELVDVSADGVLSIKTLQIIPYLVKAIQQLSNCINPTADKSTWQDTYTAAEKQIVLDKIKNKPGVPIKDGD